MHGASNGEQSRWASGGQCATSGTQIPSGIGAQAVYFVGSLEYASQWDWSDRQAIPEIPLSWNQSAWSDPHEDSQTRSATVDVPRGTLAQNASTPLTPTQLQQVRQPPFQSQCWHGWRRNGNGVRRGRREFPHPSTRAYDCSHRRL